MAEYFEDVPIGDEVTMGTYAVDEAEIVEFAERYDPQPFHTDPEAAKASMFGGLVASGWHTCAMTMSLLVEGYFSDSRALGAVGVDGLRFTAPVRPGDELSVRAEVKEKEPWDDERGLVRSRLETETAEGTTVLSMVGLVLWERRPAD